MSDKKRTLRTSSPKSIKSIVIFSFLSLFIGAFFLYQKVSMISWGESKSQDQTEPSDGKEVINKDDSIEWGSYKNIEFGYEIGLPRALLKMEYENQGGYIHFIRFGEREESLGKGVAIGIREAELEDEFTRIKGEFGKDGVLAEEREVSVGGVRGAMFIFEPESKEDLEPRTVVVFEKEGKVFSISTVPEQIDKVIASFKFLN